MKKFMLGAMAAIFLIAGMGSSATAAVNFIPPFDGQHKALAGNQAYCDGGVGITERQQMADLSKTSTSS